MPTETARQTEMKHNWEQNWNKLKVKITTWQVEILKQVKWQYGENAVNSATEHQMDWSVV